MTKQQEKMDLIADLLNRGGRITLEFTRTSEDLCLVAFISRKNPEPEFTRKERERVARNLVDEFEDACATAKNYPIRPNLDGRERARDKLVKIVSEAFLHGSAEEAIS